MQADIKAKDDAESASQIDPKKAAILLAAGLTVRYYLLDIVKIMVILAILLGDASFVAALYARSVLFLLLLCCFSAAAAAASSLLLLCCCCCFFSAASLLLLLLCCCCCFFSAAAAAAAASSLLLLLLLLPSLLLLLLLLFLPPPLGTPLSEISMSPTQVLPHVGIVPQGLCCQALRALATPGRKCVHA